VRRIAVLFCAAVLAACQRAPAPKPAEALAASAPLEVLRSGATTQGFALATVPRAFEFPADHGPHSAFRHEWWYVTGNLHARDGARYGFELTFFRVGLAPPGSLPVAAAQSHWHARELYAAHFAVTDVPRRQFQASERFARAALDLAGARADPPRVWLGGWSLGAASVPGEWTLAAADERKALHLQLRALVPPVANGEDGLSVKSGEAGAASYYFSIPRIEASGELVLDGRAVEVTGQAWLDREWGSGALGAEQTGWDWYALQFRDGSALMFYALRGRSGQRDPHSAGTFIAADGASRPLTNADVAIEVLRQWTSPRGGVYPAAWHVRVPSLGLDAEVTPVLADQELDTRPRYWEGAVDVRGRQRGALTSGEGYVELVGYAR
jgi:predicted secreted hydrolase